MTFRRLLPLLTLLALLVAPFGRMAAAEAMTTPHHQAAAMPGHCDDMPMPDQDGGDKVAIDCMIACAAVATATAPLLAFIAPMVATPVGETLPLFTGRNPSADPPPPRFS